MGRKANTVRLQAAAQLIQDRPGLLSAEYARLMGCHREIFNRLLVHLDDQGFLLSEDERGRLWLFRNSSPKR
jgi:hypothetical protein